MIFVGGALIAITSGTAEALPPAQTTFVQQSFAGASAGPNFVKPLAPNAANVACLTAGTDTSASPIPACFGTNDEAGSGALRLTDTGTNEAGGVGSTVSVPISEGLDVTFDSYQYGGTGADGLTFYLAATDPINSLAPTELGQLGGSLGYSAQAGQSGLADGYLGIGLDAWGNYPLANFGGTGCPELGTSPETITVRGPGNSDTGYCVVDQHPLGVGALRSDEPSRSATDVVPVEVVVNPSTADTAALQDSSVIVPAGSYAVIVTPVGALTPEVLIGELPSVANGKIPAGLYDDSWIDPSTGFPYKLTFGWTGGTGGKSDNHEITNFTAKTLLGESPVLGQTTTGASALQPSASSTVNVDGVVSSTGGDEEGPIVATAVFPPGFSPSDASNVSWTCVISGQTESCTYAPTTGTVSGTSLPTLSVPYTAGASEGLSTITTSLSSADAAAVSGSLDVTVAKQATAVSGTATQAPGTSTTSTAFATSVVSLAIGGATVPTGDVTFSSLSTSTVFCTATLSDGSGSCVGTVPLGTPASDILISYLGDAVHSESTGSIAAITTTLTPIETFAATAARATDTTETLSGDGLPDDATGTVTFTGADGTILCTATLPETTCTTGELTSGSYAVTATYSGDAVYASAVASTSFAITDPATPILAFTGSTLVIAMAVALGFGLLAAGGLFLFVMRRRHTV